MSNKFVKTHSGSVKYLSIQNKNKARQIVQKSVFNSYGIRVLQDIDITTRQYTQYKAIIVKIIKGANRIFESYYKRSFYDVHLDPCKVFLRFHPFWVYTAKGQGSRMGKGKGAVQFKYVPVQRGSIIFEIYTTEIDVALSCFQGLKPKIGADIRLVQLNY